MCRSIVTLRGEEPATDDEVRAAALQFVRKVSGYRTPSRTNQEVFDRAVEQITQSVRELLDGLVAAPGSKPPPMAHSRVVARAKHANFVGSTSPGGVDPTKMRRGGGADGR